MKAVMSIVNKRFMRSIFSQVTWTVTDFCWVTILLKSHSPYFDAMITERDLQKSRISQTDLTFTYHRTQAILSITRSCLLCLLTKDWPCWVYKLR